MKIFSKRQNIVVAFVVLLMFIFVFNAYAYPAAQWYSNFAGVTTAIAEKDVGYSSPDTFTCVTRSYTKYPTTNITHLGYNTFSCNVWKNGDWAGGWTRYGGVNWNSSWQGDSGVVYVNVYQSNSRKVTSAGSHDFGHYNGQSYNWDPSLSATGTYYP